MIVDGVVERALKRDRWIVLAALALVIAFSWLFILAGAGTGMSVFEMSGLNFGAAGDKPMTMPAATTATGWNPGYAIIMFFMWWIMMFAMMLPAASPMVLLFAAINRKQRADGNPFAPTSVFAGAYLVVWAGFSLLAVALQWAFEQFELLTGMMVSGNAVFSGLLLVIAGLYQLTPIKQACLRHCRSPLMFISTRWRKGIRGAVRMGLEHGAYCFGCCWFLMGLLFFGGIMNLYWIAGLAAYVLLEKTLPLGHWLGYAVGVLLAACGGWLLLSAL